MTFEIENEFWKNAVASVDNSRLSGDSLNSAFEQVIRCGSLAGFTDAQMDMLKSEIGKLRSDNALSRLWLSFYHATYGEENLNPFANNPSLEKYMPVESARAFYLILVMAGLECGERIYKKLGWPLPILHESLQDCRLWLENHMENEGFFGSTWTHCAWIYTHFRAQVLQFGRLQCNADASCHSNVRVYRHRITGKVQALMSDAIPFTKDGMAAFSDSETAFTSVVPVISESVVKGTPVRPDGIVLPEPITLELKEWKLAIKDGDKAINLHIPASGAMTPELCRDSVDRMARFFNEYKPDYDYRAVICSSWMLDPCFRMILPPDSNIVAFQKAGYVTPLKSRSEAVFRVFGQKAVSGGIDSVPHKTSMQKRFAKWASDGGVFRSGAVFLLREDLPWGSNPYI